MGGAVALQHYDAAQSAKYKLPDHTRPPRMGQRYRRRKGQRHPSLINGRVVW